MSGENIGLPDTIKYSIWQTRTKENQPIIKEKSLAPIEKPNLESKIKGD